MNKYYRIGSSVLLTLIVLAGCGGGTDGGSMTNDSITISGTISVPTGQPALVAQSTLGGAHVNVCTIQDGALTVLPAHTTVLADSSGAFVISVDKNDVPSNRQMYVCASPPNLTNYTVLAPIPEDLLPEDLTEVATISVNPNTNTTLITRYACSQPVLLFNANRCLATDQNQLQILNNALNNYFETNGGAIPDLSNLTTLLNDIANDIDVQPLLEAWLGEVDGVGLTDFIESAQDFTNPTIPTPEAVDNNSGESVSISGFSCDFSNLGDGIVEATIAVAGSAGGGNLNVFTVFFTFDGSSLSSPDTLGCGNWQQSGGLGTCTKLSVSSDTTNYIGTSSFLYNEGFEPNSVSVQVKGFQSGISTVLDSATLTVACQ
ncbi:MAG: hypothetical protein JSW20_11250 [Nitrospiraceae bacterium]|nr:MAG: hypothetical protein JSW20_11250 [Nitrospiraceae bacterium]